MSMHEVVDVTSILTPDFEHQELKSFLDSVYDFMCGEGPGYCGISEVLDTTLGLAVIPTKMKKDAIRKTKRKNASATVDSKSVSIFFYLCLLSFSFSIKCCSCKVGLINMTSYILQVSLIPS